MAKISSYTVVSNPTLSDILIGSDSNDNNATKNFNVSGLFSVFETNYRAYGSFSDNTDQVALGVNVATPLLYNSTDFSSGVNIVSVDKIVVDNSGKYNIQFSAQLHDTSGGSSTIDIWLAKNGSPVANTNTKIVMQANSYHVAAWNFFVDAASGDSFQIMWATSDLDLIIEQEAATGVHPATPSVILTVNQIA